MPAFTCSYLPPGGKQTFPCSVNSIPPLEAGHTRIVCISDTHNEHKHLIVPWGHVLVHAGDMLTESGKRYVTYDNKGACKAYDPRGVELLEGFAKWFATQPHAHKVVVAGNHDWILQALGADAVRRIFDNASAGDRRGHIAYLEHDHARVAVDGGGAPFKVFGSPYAYWGGHNDAFLHREPDFTVMEEGTHMFVTHMPPLLPKHDRLREDTDMVAAVERCGSLLQVAGHCHWAHGAYFSGKAVQTRATPYVVASVCGQWSFRYSDPDARGDPRDVKYGGYDVHFPIIVVDVDTAPPVPGAPWQLGNGLPEPDLQREETANTVTSAPEFGAGGYGVGVGDAPALLFFGPPTDTNAVTRLLPAMKVHHRVYYFDDADEAVDFLASDDATHIKFSACVSKLGSKGNLGTTVIEALLKHSTQHGYPTPFIAIHSATAMERPKVMASLEADLRIQLFVNGASEQRLLEKLRACAAFRAPTTSSLVFFGPKNDALAPRRLGPAFQELGYDVHHFTKAADAVAFIAAADPAVRTCVVKLGSSSNRGVDVLEAIRARGIPALTAVHSHTAMRSEQTMNELRAAYEVDIFVDGNSEGALLERLAAARASGSA